MNISLLAIRGLGIACFALSIAAQGQDDTSCPCPLTGWHGSSNASLYVGSAWLWPDPDSS